MRGCYARRTLRFHPGPNAPEGTGIYHIQTLCLMSHSVVRGTVVAAVAATAMAACSRSTPPAPAPAPTPLSVSSEAGPALAPTPPRPDPVQSVTPAATPVATPADDPAMSTARAAVERLGRVVVYFGYDDSTLDEDARRTLADVRELLASAPALTVRIEGHTDERGSEEYNLALGMRRAAAVRRFLQGQGIAGARLSIVSLGEERPAMPGSEESAWSRNRRAVFIVTAAAP